MRTLFAASLVALMPLAVLAADAAPPEWAYPAAPAGFMPPPDDGQPKRVEGSTKQYTEAQINNPRNPPDWFPEEHGPQPDIVMHGKPGVNACAQCHLATGYGHPESANLAGLPADYLFAQLMAFRNGDRRSMLPGRSNNMINFAKAMDAREMREAAEYFAANRNVAFTKVVETDVVAKSYVGEGNMRFAHEGGEKEPIGKRIVELPENEQNAKKRDPHSPFVAYVPTGSIAAGEALAAGGDGKTIQCSICHGTDYRGIGNVPGLASRSAIYLFRQLNDIQHGTRHGGNVGLMQPVVAKLSEDDMIALAAFMASRKP